MAGTLEMDWEAMVTAARNLANQAVDLKSELDSIERDWDDLSSIWTGTAASTFAPPWQEWHEGAKQVAAVLEDSCELLRRAATVYVDQDNYGAEAIATSAGMDSSL